MGQFRNIGKAHFWSVVTTLLLALVVSAADQGFPWLTKMILDDVLGAGNRELLIPVLASIIGLALFVIGCQLLRRHITAKMSASMTNSLRINLISHYLSVPYEAAAKTQTGNLVSLLMADAKELIQLYVMTKSSKLVPGTFLRLFADVFTSMTNQVIHTVL